MTIPEGYYNKNRFDEFEAVANQYASSIGVTVLKSIGDGNFGVAFITNQLKVIKVTIDPLEVVCAAKLLNKDLDNVAQIYDVKATSQYAVIHQELIKTLTDEEKHQFNQLESKLSEAETSYICLDIECTRDYGISFSEAEFLMAKQVHDSVNQVFGAGGKAYDVHDENVGWTRGKLVVFDQKDLHVEPESCKNEYEEIVKESGHWLNLTAEPTPEKSKLSRTFVPT
ncbi:hypothetical protein VCHA53O466_50432 [Vibrio chagasii]|nr:hypothetical protein VCHA53O466_50432 [Vibrio chagasii]